MINLYGVVVVVVLAHASTVVQSTVVQGCTDFPDCISCPRAPGALEGTCTGCMRPFQYLDEPPNYPLCKDCRDFKNCFSCTKTLCTQCTTLEFGPDRNGVPTCSPCAANCAYCWGAGSGKCDNCNPGYYLSNGVCTPCNSNCEFCHNSETCDICDSGFSRTEEASCTKPSSGFVSPTIT